jgi:hypothetical protein
MKVPKWSVSIYPLLSSKTGFTRYFYYPPTSKVFLHLVVNVLGDIPRRDNEKFTIIINKLEGEDGLELEDIPHSAPIRYRCTWAVKNKTSREIIKKCLNDKDDDEDDDDDENEDDDEMDQNEVDDLIPREILEWEDESPEDVIENEQMSRGLASLSPINVAI